MASSLTWPGVAYAGGLSAVAGFVDAVAYLHLGGYFVSFMSGNTTRASASLVNGSVEGTVLALGLILFFVVGVVASTFAFPGPRKGRRAKVLGTATAVLGLAAATPLLGAEVIAPPLLAAAMGVVNTSYVKKGEVTIGLTYMTGTLVKIGQYFVAALKGGEHSRWLKYLSLWAMISVGGVCGAIAYHVLGLPSLWIATGLMAIWTVLATRRDRR